MQFSEIITSKGEDESTEMPLYTKSTTQLWIFKELFRFLFIYLFLQVQTCMNNTIHHSICRLSSLLMQCLFLIGLLITSWSDSLHQQCKGFILLTSQLWKVDISVKSRQMHWSNTSQHFTDVKCYHLIEWLSLILMSLVIYNTLLYQVIDKMMRCFLAWSVFNKQKLFLF